MRNTAVAKHNLIFDLQVFIASAQSPPGTRLDEAPVALCSYPLLAFGVCIQYCLAIIWWKIPAVSWMVDSFSFISDEQTQLQETPQGYLYIIESAALC